MSLLGKRKRERRVTRDQLSAAQTASDSSSESSDSHSQDEHDGQDDLRSAFTRAFNARFEPLSTSVSSSTVASSPKRNGTSVAPKAKAPRMTIEELCDEDEDDEDGNGTQDSEDSDEFEGFDDDTVQIIEIVTPDGPSSGMSVEKRKFMSSKPPLSMPQSSSMSKPKTSLKATDDDDEESANLKNDLALQRLLSESHLLQNLEAVNDSTNVKIRHKQTDLRMSSLGARSSILAQTKMPASHRKGIREKAMRREEMRRREAKENGVILERPRINSEAGASQRKKPRSADKRERGITGSGNLGKFKGGTLKLSKADVADIKNFRVRGSSRRGRSTKFGKW